MTAALASADAPGSSERARFDEGYGQVPLAFEANAGQTDAEVAFLARGAGYALFLTPREAVLSLRFNAPRGESASTSPPPVRDSTPPAVLRLRCRGANRSPRVTGLDAQTGRSNYFVGNDPSRWRTDVPHFGKVRYQQVYPGIDLVYYGRQSQLEFDFVVQPGADPGRIGLDFEGADRIEIDVQGDLLVHVRGATLRQHKPVVYQEQGGERQTVAGAYAVRGRRRAAFRLGAYDPTRPLVIDPVLVYSTYLGGSAEDSGNGIAVDGSGAAYLTGGTPSTNFPTANPIQAAYAGGLGGDVFVTKLNASGSALVYSTYLGGSIPYTGGSAAGDTGVAIAVDGSGNAYVTGYTSSTNFPTANPLQGALAGFSDAFVVKLNASGSALVYSTYLGGSSNNDLASGIAVDGSGNAYVTGTTYSTNFPTASPMQPARAGVDDAFVAKLNPAGSALAYSTYLGGSSYNGGADIAVDGFGNTYVTGYVSSTNFPTANPVQAAYGGGVSDAFVAKLNAAGSALVYSTYLGGSASDDGSGIAVDGSGNAYVTGSTRSSNFPTANPLQGAFAGLQDVFVAKLNSAGSALAYSTYLGGSDYDYGYGIALDAPGNAYLTGDTKSTNFPTASPIQGTNAGGKDAFVTKLNVAGSAIVYSTYLGGGTDDAGYDIAVDGSGRTYLTGLTRSSYFPTANPIQAALAGGNDAFVSKIATSPARNDFDADNRSDLAVYHASSGLWFIRNSTTGGSAGFGFGGPGYVPVARDYDGDLRTEAAMYHPPTGLWFFRNPQTGAVTSQGWGGAAYEAVPGDYDGDGKTDVAAFHTTLGLWFIRQSSLGGAQATYDFGGGGGYTTVPRDYDGDGKTDLAVYSASTGLWYVRSSSTGLTTSVGFGGTSYRPVPGDYDGDGKADIAVYHTTLGIWFVKNSSTGTVTSVDFGGGPGFTPVPGHFDGDAKLDLALYSESTGLWFWRLSTTGAVLSQGYGGPGYAAVLP